MSWAVSGASRRRLRDAVVLLSALLLIAASVMLGERAVADEDRDEIDRKVDAAGDLVVDANAEVAAAAAALAEAKAQLPAARARLQAANEAKRKAKEAHEKAQADLEVATGELILAEQELLRIEQEFENLRSDVGDFARRAYQMGPFAELEMVLDAEDPAELTDRVAAIRAVSAANNEALGQISANRADQAYTQQRAEALREIARQKEELAQQKLAEAKAAAAEAKAAKKAVTFLIAQRNDALAIAKANQSSVRRQYSQLRAEQQRIAQAAQNAAGAAGLTGGGSASGGSYTWPIAGGWVTQYAGPRIHPVYGYRSCHTGVDISGGYGTPIRAAADGVVATSANYGPYGLHTLIAHGGGISSFYAHQSSVAVYPGKRVSRGQVIGYVGSTGWSTGPHLHFEIHVNGVPYNPMGWYGSGRYPVGC